MRGSRAVLLLFFLPLLASCEAIFSPRACTLIGCTDGLTVQMVDLPVGACTLEVLLPGGEIRTFECAQASAFPAHLFVPGVAAEEITLRVTTEAGVRTETGRPVYSKLRPNGRGCPPVCWQAEVTMRLSA
jgi:hypothetical protein